MDEDVSRTKTPGPTPYVGACILSVMRSKPGGYVEIENLPVNHISVLVSFPWNRDTRKKKCIILSVVKLVVIRVVK